MKHVKTVAVCAVVALGVGATSATAGSLMTSAKIKDGTIQMRDLSPSLQAKIKHASTGKVRAGAQVTKGDTGAPGANGANGAPGAAGTNGLNGLNGHDGKDGKDGKDGIDGRAGKDGVRYDRITGSCDLNGIPGEVSVAGGAARLGVPDQMAYAQIRSYPHDLKLSDLDRLSFRSNATDPGVVYMKITTEGHGSVLFSPSTQPGGERGLHSWAAHDVLDGTVRFDDDAGKSADIKWSDVLDLAGNKQVKDIRFTAGCANPVGNDGGLVQVDDLTVNDEVIDFS